MKVILGSGEDIREGWTCIDAVPRSNKSNFIQWDLTKGLPQEVNNIEEIYSCHFGEHLHHKDFVRLLKDCYSKLVPGGTIRTCLPDFKRLAINYVNRNWAFFEHCRSSAPNNQLMEIINEAVYQYYPSAPYEAHKTMFDPEYAIFTHKLAGFKDVKEVEFDPAYGDPGRKDYSFYILSTK